MRRLSSFACDNCPSCHSGNWIALPLHWFYFRCPACWCPALAPLSKWIEFLHISCHTVLKLWRCKDVKNTWNIIVAGHQDPSLHVHSGQELIANIYECWVYWGKVHEECGSCGDHGEWTGTERKSPVLYKQQRRKEVLGLEEWWSKQDAYFQFVDFWKMCSPSSK